MTEEQKSKSSRRYRWLAAVLLALATMFSVLGYVILNADEINHVAHDESSAVGSLRDLDKKLVAYARAHPTEGYPSSLDCAAQIRNGVSVVIFRGSVSGLHSRVS